MREQKGQVKCGQIGKSLKFWIKDFEYDFKRELKRHYRHFLFKKFYSIYLVTLGPCCCMQDFSSCCMQDFSSLASGGYSLLQCTNFLLWWLLLLWSTGPRCTWARLWCTVLVALQHRTRDQTCVPCIGRWIFIHCTTREVQPFLFKCSFCFFFWLHLTACGILVP